MLQAGIHMWQKVMRRIRGIKRICILHHHVLHQSKHPHVVWQASLLDLASFYLRDADMFAAAGQICLDGMYTHIAECSYLPPCRYCKLLQRIGVLLRYVCCKVVLAVYHLILSAWKFGLSHCICQISVGSLLSGVFLFAKACAYQ